jgi:S-adenosylmethionine:tRNA ribosyltransferase-isomerase
MHPKHLHIKDFTYPLPDDRIAQYPLAERDLSKLLIYSNGQITEDTYNHITHHLPEQALLVFNNTRVIQARLLFKNATGATIEVFCLQPAEEKTEMANAMSQTKSVRWHCLVGRASKWKEKILEQRTEGFLLTAEIIDRTDDAFVIEFTWQPELLTFAEILDKAGQLPIPPYLKRQTEQVDLERYQTIYAASKGSVAAPTAGLHFTPAIIESLEEKNIATDQVTLHVGAGTFKPVKSETMQNHTMHAEVIEVGIESLRNLLKWEPNNIIAVGTTSLRTIESLYWMGVKAKQNPDASIDDLEIQQWDAYDLPQDVPQQLALESLLAWMQANGMQKLICKTQIIIAPPYKLKVAKALITNFHQPNSTLLLLVAAVTGNNWRTIYDYALRHNFRFLSYGDGSLLYSG